MRAVLVLCLAVAAIAQQPRSTTTYTYDVHGRRMEGARTVEYKTDGESMSTELVRTVNGGTAPTENVEQRVISEDANGKVIERVVRGYDQNGNPMPPRKIQIEERRLWDGSTRTITTVYRGDLNGRMTLSERNSQESREQDGSSTISSQTERPSINGGLEVVEKSSATAVKTQTGLQETRVIYRPGSSGRFQIAAQTVTERTEHNGQTTETVNQYNNAATGQMQLALQTVTQISKDPDGSETRQVSIYGVNAPGRPITGQAELREQQLIERRAGAGNTVVESFSIRRPGANAGTLGDYQKISERVCSGCTLENK